MVDESWIYLYGYDPEAKQQSSQWKSPQSPRAKISYSSMCCAYPAVGHIKYFQYDTFYLRQEAY
jgi:hypothetical protein